MKIEIKVINLTRSKINQMDYISIPKNTNIKVLGWVNLDKKRWVIVKSSGCYYRASFLKSVTKEEKGVQFRLLSGGWEFPYLTNVKSESYNGGNTSYIVDRNDAKNIELFNNLVSLKRKSEIAGQIYY